MPRRVPEQPADTPERPSFTLSEAADVCSSSRQTMRRRLDDGAFPDAWRESGKAGPGTGPWRIPVDNLLAAGFHPRGPEQVSQQTDREQPDETPRVSELERENARLRAELAEWRARAEERDRTIEVATAAMRALPSPTAERRPWWRR